VLSAVKTACAGFFHLYDLLDFQLTRKKKINQSIKQNDARHSGLLKLWLRDLREPLCTTGMFSSFIGTVGEDAEVHEKTVEVCLFCPVLLLF
jgi:hypothetical protein